MNEKNLSLISVLLLILGVVLTGFYWFHQFNYLPVLIGACLFGASARFFLVSLHKTEDSKPLIRERFCIDEHMLCMLCSLLQVTGLVLIIARKSLSDFTILIGICGFAAFIKIFLASVWEKNDAYNPSFNILGAGAGIGILVCECFI